MDTSVVPLPGDMILRVDGVPKDIDTITWDNATHLEIRYSEIALGPAAVTIQLPTKIPAFRSVHLFEIWPFTMTAIPD